MTENKEWLEQVKKDFCSNFVSVPYENLEEILLRNVCLAEKFKGYRLRAEKDREEIEKWKKRAFWGDDEVNSLKSQLSEKDKIIEVRIGDVDFWKKNAEHFYDCSREKDQTIMNLDEEIQKLKSLIAQARSWVTVLPTDSQETVAKIEKWLEETKNIVEEK